MKHNRKPRETGRPLKEVTCSVLKRNWAKLSAYVVILCLPPHCSGSILSLASPSTLLEEAMGVESEYLSFNSDLPILL